MHIGGGLSRAGSRVRTVHLAEIPRQRKPFHDNLLGTLGFGNLRGEEGFPAAARRALRNAQMRRNVGHATWAIRHQEACRGG